MVLHGITLDDLVSYVIYLACFCVLRFVARAVSRKTPIPLIVFSLPPGESESEDPNKIAGSLRLTASPYYQTRCEYKMSLTMIVPMPVSTTSQKVILVPQDVSDVIPVTH